MQMAIKMKVKKLAGKSFTSLSALTAYLQKQINETLLDEVSDTVKDEIESSISDVVFSAGEPVWYSRRSQYNGLNSGGLADKAEMDTTLISDGTIEIVDNAKPSRPWGLRLDQAIEYGYNQKQNWWDKPRPFIAESKENLKKSKAHIESMRDGLIKRGLDIL